HQRLLPQYPNLCTKPLNAPYNAGILSCKSPSTPYGNHCTFNNTSLSGELKWLGTIYPQIVRMEVISRL
uniref:Uncharacterized protein n=1 Tax=Physcomitrium patens TaxID=3218 RepID=A0A7I3ZZ37_PHYPA